MGIPQRRQRGIRKPIVSAKLDADVLSRVDSYAESIGASRSGAIAQLVELGLGAEPVSGRLSSELNDARARIVAARKALG